MISPDRLIFGLAVALAGQVLPVKFDAERLDRAFDALEAESGRAVPGSPGDAWPRVTDFLGRVRAASEAFDEVVSQRLPDAEFVVLHEAADSNSDLQGADLALARELQRHALDQLATDGVWRDLAELAERPRGGFAVPMVRNRDMGMSLFTMMRVSAQIAAMQVGLAAERGEWDRAAEALLAIKAIERGADARGTLIGRLLARAVERTGFLAMNRHLPGMRPTRGQCLDLLARLDAADAMMMGASFTWRSEELYWLETMELQREFGTFGPLDGVRRDVQPSFPVGELEFLAPSQSVLEGVSRIGVRMFGPWLARRHESEAVLRSGLFRMSRLHLSGPRETASQRRKFTAHTRALPARFICESIALRHVSGLLRAHLNQPHEVTCTRGARRLLLGLLAYRAVHGAFPERLGALVPAVLDTLPTDPFAPDGGFGYRPRPDGAGFSLYSVGFDGVDHGATPGEYPMSAFASDAAGTDVVFVPWKPAQEQ